MSDIEKMRSWIATFPEHQKLDGFQVDYTDSVPNNGGIFPSGLVEVSRKADIFGNITVENQYNFGLYYVFLKSPGDDEGAAVNADWVMDFQKWVQEQSLRHLAPTFGDDPSTERIQAQNGVLYDADEEGTATYMVQLSVNFIKEIRSESKWLI
ncbi:MAG: hypothetical protein IJF02_05120 [Oscillospiraceae bacterium]|nr:hypothetical protein [Oscillospiraceae bacterium]MBQ6852376.1 hypothetical protein [Oscillospiraceae bacterium]